MQQDVAWPRAVRGWAVEYGVASGSDQDKSWLHCDKRQAEHTGGPGSPLQSGLEAKVDSLCRPVSQGPATAGNACPLCTLVLFDPCEMAAIDQHQETEKSQGRSFLFCICYVAGHDPLLPVPC